MAQIEDVPRTGTGAAQQVMNARAQLRQRRKQYRRIEVALDRRTVADLAPCLVNVDAPIDAQHVAAGRVQLFEEAARPGAEVDQRMKLLLALVAAVLFKMEG